MSTSADVSSEIRAIADLLAMAAYDTTVTFDDISATIGRDIKPCRYLIYAAMRVLETESGAVFASRRGVGYLRLSPDDAHRIGHTCRRRIRQSARRARQSITAATRVANHLSPESQRSANAEISALALIEHTARDTHAAPVESHAHAPDSVAASARRLFERLGDTHSTAEA